MRSISLLWLMARAHKPNWASLCWAPPSLLEWPNHEGLTLNFQGLQIPTPTTIMKKVKAMKAQRLRRRCRQYTTHHGRQVKSPKRK
ncbi:hypothetical protein V6N13_118351 [Hibiscus sabdariffa]|uniref:Secreted protein n=1 Tax=Hibiscus sabdariffa TaxID=183260 RepID=A0ABR2Q835_9ROSI